jgi:hypothetical protein
VRVVCLGALSDMVCCGGNPGHQSVFLPERLW